MAKGSQSHETKYIVLVSRRAAGVWTHLPSITYMLLDKFGSPPRPIVWVDFGRRYEMLNHLLIDPARFPASSSLIDMFNSNRFNNVVTYSQAIAHEWSDVEHAKTRLSEIQGENVATYCEYVNKLRLEGRDACLLPIQVPSLQNRASGFDLSTSDVELALTRIEQQLRPTIVFLTFEGQPEALVFARKLEEQTLLRWCLDKAGLILSMVRFDSKQRFEDSVAIPTELSRSSILSDRLRVVLTRCLDPPIVSKDLQKYVLGSLPFADFIGVSVNNGRIPLIDILSSQSAALTGPQDAYIKSLTLFTEQLIGSL